MRMAVVTKSDSVLTGYENILGGKYLHSVIETAEGVIIDFTKNLIMPKEEYINLTGFTILEKITNEELLEIWTKMDLDMDSKVLSVFGKEILKDLKKNPSLFKENYDIKKIIMESRENERHNDERD